MIGILSIQGGVEEHEQVLDQLGLAHKRVRDVDGTVGLTGLIIPGGESTVMDLFMKQYGMDTWLKKHVGELRIYGTCAGLILLARYGLLHVEVERNAYGRQLASFTTQVSVKDLGFVRAHFIRAPKITQVRDGVEVLAEHDGAPVLVRQGAVWGGSFHPELAGETTLHQIIFS